ncbi:hypothetical protein M758_3G186600 [Ceratodon purpureus]|uniref:Uncharacterized protein n=1 Tax=Ceratodon purpureus TaxID=3225 RepID=A0A8T0INW4_CERPU|nr:hypothetical protein KC19_3G187700 [Ceratodon purpureus]KAG0623601.1 hypothetical protein M758_3G186600 [Ceratodon purpureus]
MRGAWKAGAGVAVFRRALEVSVLAICTYFFRSEGDQGGCSWWEKLVGVWMIGRSRKQRS